MIIRVVERALAVCSDVVVATDDERIFTTVTEQGYRAVMTSPDHQSGTERCLEAYQLLAEPADVLINLQGDEPFIADEQIRLLISAFDDPSVDLATLAQPFPSTATNEELANPNAVKLVRSTSTGYALYFSRSVIPYLRSVERPWAKEHTFLKHIGLYAFRTHVLPTIQSLPPPRWRRASVSSSSVGSRLGCASVSCSLTKSPSASIRPKTSSAFLSNPSP